MPDEAEPIVVNTGPLIALGSCGHIELLRRFHSRVIVPEAVMTELWRGERAGGHITRSLLCPEWMEIAGPRRSAIARGRLSSSFRAERATMTW